MTDLLIHIQEIIGQTVQEFAIQKVSEQERPYGFFVVFSSGCYFWTFHEWAFIHSGTTVTHSFMTDGEDFYTVLETVTKKKVVNVRIDEETMNLFITLENNYKIIFQPSSSYAKEYCLWGFKNPSARRIIYINNVSEIVIRDTYYGDDGNLERLKSDLSELIGQQVSYSCCGGGASSILLLKTNNDKNCVWGWGYWEIYQGEKLLACSEDEDTPIIGKMAVAAHQLQGSIIKDVVLDEDTLDLSILFDNACRWIIITRFSEQVSLQNWEYELPEKNLFYQITSSLDIKIDAYDTH